MQSRLLPFLSSPASWSSDPHFARRGRSLLGLVLFNCCVGLVFWASRRNEALLPTLVVANGIGLSASLLGVVADKLARGNLALAPKVIIIAPASVFIGFEIAASTIGHVPHLIGHASVKVWLAHGSSFVVAGAACAFVSVYMQAARPIAYTEVVTASDRYVIRAPLKELMHRLDMERFAQVHRSVIVAYWAIDRIERDLFGRLHVRLRGRNETLPVSRANAGLFKNM